MCNICKEGTATPEDLLTIEEFKQYLSILHEGMDKFGLSRFKAQEYAATEVYGDKFAQGTRRKEA